MSFVVTKKDNSAYRKMVRRQQVSDVIAYGHITTTLAQAKELKRHVDKLITLAKKNDLSSKKKIMSIILDNKNMSREKLLDKLTKDLAKKYADRKGGYTRVLRLDNRQGDNTKVAIIQLV